MSRLFDGTDDYIYCSLGPANSTLDGAFTFSFCIRPDSSHYGGIINTTGGNDWAVWVDGTDVVIFTGSGPERGFWGVLDIGDVQEVHLSKPDGTATPRIHVYNRDTDDWTHANGSGTVANDSASAGRYWVIGREDYVGATFNGAISAIALYGSAIASDGAAEARKGWAAWMAAGPAIAWDLRTVPLVDVGSAGTANQTAINGTTADTPPAGFFPAAGNEVEGEVSLEGTGTLSAAGRRIRHASAGLSGEGTLAADAGAIRHGAVSLAGAAALTAEAAAIRSGAVSLAGVGSLAADADVIGAVNIVTAEASLAGTGALAATPMAIRGGSATLQGVGTLIVRESTTPVHRNPRVSILPYLSGLDLEPYSGSLAVTPVDSSVAVMPRQSSIVIEED